MTSHQAQNNRTGVRVDIRNLSKGFSGVTVLHNISLSVEPGEIFVIMGPSGSGKSVLLRQIIGLETADSGEILLDGRPASDNAVREELRLAMVFQAGGLLNSLTVEENIGLYLAEHRLKPAREIARVVAEKIALVQLPPETAKKYPGELSGGMRKRVAIARALVSEPQLILYDEPTSELDPLVSVTIGKEILALNRRSHATSIVVSHDRDLGLGIADRVAFLAEGRLRVVGTPDQIRKSPDPLLQQFLNAEFRI